MKDWLHRTLDDWLLRQDVGRVAAEGRGQVIMDDAGSIYLVRVYLVRVMRSHIPGLFLHRFFRSDHDRELHNHPWKWALSLVLTKGYVEERMDGLGREVVRRRIRPLTLNLIREHTYHRVQLVDEGAGAWTLFLAGPRVGRWGFIDPATSRYEDFEARALRLREDGYVAS